MTTLAAELNEAPAEEAAADQAAAELIATAADQYESEGMCAFAGNTSTTLDQKSIFDAAYNLQSEQCMFSGEVIDSTMPYLARQLGYYMI